MSYRDEHVYKITLTDITGRGRRTRGRLKREEETYLQVKLEQDKKRGGNMGWQGKRKGDFYQTYDFPFSIPFTRGGRTLFFCRSRFISFPLSFSLYLSFNSRLPVISTRVASRDLETRGRKFNYVWRAARSIPSRVSPALPAVVEERAI